MREQVDRMSRRDEEVFACPGHDVAAEAHAVAFDGLGNELSKSS